MHVQSNLSVTIPRDPNFKPPQTREEFERLDYTARAQLQAEYPDVYKLFVNPKA